jgi:cytochrome c553
MKKLLKWVGIVLGGLVGLIAVAAIALYASGSARLNKTYDIPVETIAIPKDGAAITRGRHLAEAMAFCTACHGEDLGGEVQDDDSMVFTFAPPNLTAGRGGVGATLSEADYVRAIRHGVNPQGRGLLIMHSDAYHNMSEEDLGAVIAFAKSMPPVDNEVAKTRVAPLGRIFVALGMFDVETVPLIPAEVIDHATPFVHAPAPGPTVEYGEYLMSISLCRMCHGPDLTGGPSIEPGMPPGPNIAAHAASGGGWTEDEFAAVLRSGVTPSGRTLNPEHMPWNLTAKLTDEEITALWLYLQTLPPQANGNQ